MRPFFGSQNVILGRVTTGPGRGQADITGRLYQAACRPPVYSFLESLDCFHMGDPMKNFRKKKISKFFPKLNFLEWANVDDVPVRVL